MEKKIEIYFKGSEVNRMVKQGERGYVVIDFVLNIDDTGNATVKNYIAHMNSVYVDSDDVVNFKGIEINGCPMPPCVRKPAMIGVGDKIESNTDCEKQIISSLGLEPKSEIM